MAHGVPWWDYHVPLQLFLRGVHTRVVREPVAFHLQHEERWDDRLWRRFGLRYANFVLDNRPRMPDPIAYRIRGRSRRFRLAAMRTRLFHERLGSFLERLALATVGFIDDR